MAKKADKQEEIEFRYTYADGHQVCPASGIWGGAAGPDHLTLSFFIEGREPPESVTHRVEDGVLKDQVGQKPVLTHPVIERRILTSVYMTVDTAKMVAQWITDRVKELEQLKAQEPTG